MHLTTLEWDLDASCSDPSGSPRRIVYRRATSPERLASLARDDRDVLIASGDLTDVAHPVMAITDSALGPVVHVVFNAGIDRALYYWRLPPGVSESPQPIALAPMPHGPAALAADMENRLYVASRDAERFMLCPLYPDGVARDECGIPDSTAVDPLVRDIAFGAPLAAADTPTHDCAPLGELHYRCMRDEKPFSITADKLARHRVFVAFTAADAGATSVYVTSWCGGAASAPQDCLNPGWLTPLRVNGRPDGDTSLYFDPEITVDGKGELVVSYAAVDAAPSAAPGRTFIERGQIFNDIPFHQASPAPPYTGAWDLSSVPFDCASRRWALGHQRQADIVDARSFHLVREGEGHTGRWLSEYVHP